MVWAVVFCIAIALLDVYTDYLKPARGLVGSLSAPFHWVVSVPNRLSDWSEERLVSRVQLQEENERLREELLILQRKIQQFAQVSSDNVRLRELMNAAEHFEDRVVVAEMIGVSPDPLSHKVIINRGRVHGVYVGQPLLDAFGLMGQVVSVSERSSEILLITDTTHALPVEVRRNGVRAIVDGLGDLFEVRLRHVPNTVDIAVGDDLVSSGLGNVYPRGYPVARVKEVIHDPSLPFAIVKAEPMAQMNRSRHVLLVFSQHREALVQPSFAQVHNASSSTP